MGRDLTGANLALTHTGDRRIIAVSTTTVPSRNADSLRPDFWIPSEREYHTYVAPDVTAMTTDWELCLYEAFARDAYRGDGQIVDLGCWLGATTRVLARGLDRNKHVEDPAPIEAYDLFRWTLEMDGLVGEDTDVADRFLPGDSYYAETQKNVHGYGDLVRLHERDLVGWVPPAEPIEFLLVDAKKTWPLGHSITTGFFPHLIEGSAYVVQQDFCYHRLNEVATRMITWYLRDHLEPVHHVPMSSSVVFRCTKRIDGSALPAFSADLFTPAAIDEAYEWCCACVPEEDRSYIRVGKVCHLIDIGLADRAAAEAERMRSEEIAIHESSRAYALACADSAEGPFGRAGEEDSEALATIRAALREAPSAGA
jgi:hypothetical protein